MNELAQSISRLYEPDSAPVIAVSGGIIIFCNPAAAAFITGIEPGKRASDILPYSFLHCDEEVFVTTAKVSDRAVSAIGIWYNGMLLLRLNLAPVVYEFSAESFSAGMRTELAGIRIALEHIDKESSASSLISEKCGSALAVLRHSYYKLLRRCENTELAYNLTNRISVFRPLRMDPAEWLSEMTALLKEPVEKLGIKLQYNRPSNIGDIPADRALLEHMLLNLVSNSLRHMNPGDKLTFRLNRQGRRLQLFVEDSGAGFSGEKLRGLYQRSVSSDLESNFRRERLGLLIVWGIVDLHRGSVTVTNRSRGGASVCISLPTELHGALPLLSPSVPYRARYSEDEHILAALSETLPDAYYTIFRRPATEY